jgi:putative chitinase
VPTIDAAQLAKLCPKTPAATLTALATALNAELPAGKIDTPARIAHFLAQCAHESGGFQRMEENLNYSAKRLREVFPKYFTEAQAAEYGGKKEKIANRVYGGRMGNGDEASGDGYRFRGRGIIQLTGRSNYRKYGGPEIENNPDSAGTLPAAVKIAVSYWNINKCSPMADKDDVKGITKAINGGEVGLAERQKLVAQAKKIWT